MAYFEKFWDCPACGTQGISALRKMKCPNCGHSKTSQDEEHFSNIEITDEDGLALAAGDPHWNCSSCGSVNLDKFPNCIGCGSPREESDQSNQVIELGSQPLPDYTPPGSEQWYAPRRDETEFRKALDEVLSEYEEPAPDLSVNRLSRLPWIPIIIATTVVLIVGAVWLLFFRTTEVEAQVTGFSWSREVHIDKYRTEHRSGWLLPPGDAYNVSSSTRLHHYEPIYETRSRTVRHSRTCYRDNGNGSVQSYDCSYTTTEFYQVKVGDRPIYDTWYEYDIDVWRHERTVKAGDDDRTPYWPQYTLHLDGQRVIGAEKVGGTSETYTVHFLSLDTEEPEDYSYSTSIAEWARYDLEVTYTLKVNRLGQIRNNPLKDLEAQ